MDNDYYGHFLLRAWEEYEDLEWKNTVKLSFYQYCDLKLKYYNDEI